MASATSTTAAAASAAADAAADGSALLGGSVRVPGNWQWRVGTAMVAAGLGLAAWRTRMARQSQEMAKDKYLLRIRSLALRRLSSGDKTEMHLKNAMEHKPTSEEKKAVKQFHLDIAAQTRCYLGVKMNDSLERAEKCGFTGEVKVERRISDMPDAGMGVFVKQDDENRNTNFGPAVRAGELVAIYKGRVYTDNLRTNMNCLLSGSSYRLWQDTSHLVSFGTSGGFAFTTNGLEEPNFEVRKELLPISCAAFINHPPAGKSPNCFFYGPVILKKGNPNESCLPTGFAPECSGRDEDLEHPPIVVAVALRDLEPGEELLVDYELSGSRAPAWYTHVPLSLAVPGVALAQA